MADSRDVVLNPVLRLRTTPVREKVTGRSKDARKITPALYEQRRANLISRLSIIREAPRTVAATHGGRVLIWVGMDANSQASTHTPYDLFSDSVHAEMRSAWRSGYVVELRSRAFDHLIDRVQRPHSDAERCDIFRIDSVELFADVLNAAEESSKAWDHAIADDSTGLRSFNVRLAPFFAENSRASVVETLVRLAEDAQIALPVSVTTTRPDGAPADAQTGWLPSAVLRSVVQSRKQAGVLPLGLRDRGALRRLIASGAVVRWEPVRPLRPTMPGVGPEPDPLLPELDNEPVVGMIDGGYHGSRYRHAIAWKLEPVLVADAHAARQHGNKVASVLVDGHLWSNQLDIPHLHCRIGVVQAVPDPSSRAAIFDEHILGHVERAFRENPETHVWNLSANYEDECDEFEVSELGHGLTRLARAYNKLLVISAGNRKSTLRIAPPADCEAALVVGGRMHDENGRPAGPCALSRTGFGPEGMLKPETSWFSEHRVLGGGVDRGTSFAAPLVSRLAAHTWKNLSEPNPDLVRALLISACDLPAYSEALGFGSPITPTFPWSCPSNAATVAWTAEITALRRYYWTGIRVPPSLIQNGRFVGRAKLVAILEPVLQSEGHHYASTRLEAGLQYRKPKKGGGMQNVTMLGTMNPSEREIRARTYDHKWDPVRVYADEFTSRNGPVLAGNPPTLQLYARMFWRNQFMYAEDFMRDHVARVSFVVTLAAHDADADVYNEFVRIMAENVETAVVEQDLEIDVDDLIG